MNISEGRGVVFKEERPYKSTYYYILIVSSAVINFDIGKFMLCFYL